MRQYVIVTPVKNESLFIGKTIDSIMKQTRLPHKWVLVNDGSTDTTREIIEEHMTRFDSIILVNRANVTKRRRRGQGIIEAFYTGYERVKDDDFDYLVKLDGDLVLPPDFFEIVLDAFEKNPALGIASGINYSLVNGEYVKEYAAGGFTWGATKIYRRQCFEGIGGLVPRMGWDGIDHIKAVMLGWEAKSIEDAPFYQQRPEGKETGMLRTAVEEGVCCHFMGYHPLFFLLRCVKRMAANPMLLGGVAMLMSYLKCRLLGEETINDPQFISFLRKNQLERMRSGKKEYAW